MPKGKPDPQKEREKAQALPKADDFRALRRAKFAALVEKRHSRFLEKKALEAEIKVLDDTMKSLLVTTGQKSLLVAERYKVTLVEQSQSRLSRQKLVELGVSEKILKKATTTSTNYYPKVTDLEAEPTTEGIGEELLEDAG